MAEFDALLAEYTQKENPKIHGAIIKCVDSKGREIYSKVAGHRSLEPGAELLAEDAVLKLASATKLITSVALLQCIDRGLIALDEPLERVLPEFKDKKILVDIQGPNFTYETSKTPITARHLLSHTSGLGYPFTHPLLRLRAEARTEAPSLRVTERYAMPLVFEPGTGWLYGCSLDWAGVAVSRLNDGVTLEDYLIEHVWKRLGLKAPFPCFNISKHPEYNARILHGAKRTPEGELQPSDDWAFDNPVDMEGGSGLSATTRDYVAVLADLISDSPKLLKPSTIAEMFIPQLPPKSQAINGLLALRPAWGTVSGPIAEDRVNHGLGGLLCQGSVPEINQPADMLGWGGASNIIWWINKEQGVAGFFATQQSPFGNSSVTTLVNAWKKDFWTQHLKGNQAQHVH